jgi:hypothetical protein
VLDGASDGGVAGAMVRLLTSPERARSDGFVLDSTVLQVALSADDGAVEFVRPSGTGEATIGVHAGADGYSPTLIDLPSLSELSVIELTLQRSTVRLRGRAVDPSGEPIPDMRLQFQHVSLPRDLALASSASTEGRRVPLVVTDPAGRFEARGVVPGGYIARVLTPGWVVSEGAGPRLSTARAETENEIVVYPMALFRVRFLDRETGAACSEPRDDPPTSSPLTEAASGVGARRPARRLHRWDLAAHRNGSVAGWRRNWVHPTWVRSDPGRERRAIWAARTGAGIRQRHGQDPAVEPGRLGGWSCR